MEEYNVYSVENVLPIVSVQVPARVSEHTMAVSVGLFLGE